MPTFMSYSMRRVASLKELLYSNMSYGLRLSEGLLRDPLEPTSLAVANVLTTKSPSKPL